MAAGVKLEVQGLNETINRLKKAGKDIAVETDAELQAAAVNVERVASQRVPVDTGRLKNAISQRKVGNMSYEIVAQTNYAAYVEFGTGTGVDVPNGLESYAMQFKGKGVRKVNRRAKPFMFPALFQEKRPLLERLTKILKRNR